MFPKELIKGNDIYVNELRVLENMSSAGHNLDSFEKCTQTSEDHFLQLDYINQGVLCSKHQGMSGAFDDRFNYINDTRYLDNTKYCGWKVGPYMTTKNVIYHKADDVRNRVEWATAMPSPLMKMKRWIK